MPEILQTIYYGDGPYGDGYIDDALSQSRETSTVNKALTPLPPPIFTGMKLKEDVVIGDLVLNKIDSNNVLWVCTDIEGWWVHPDPEIPDVTRGWRDGSYDARGRWQARQITLTGVIFPPDPTYLPAARDSLVQATNLVYSGAWLMTKENPTRAAWVRLSGRPEIRTVNARGRTEFSIGLRAADPVKYSWNSSDPDGYSSVVIPCKNSGTSETGQTTITNVGNTSVTTFLEVTGPTVGNTTIENLTTGETMTITSALRSSETRTVTNKELTSNVATLTFSASHNMIAGDTVVVTGVDSTFNGTYTVYDVPAANKIGYELVSGNVSLTGATGSVARTADVLQIDTYEREVSYNGDTTGARAKVATLTDWLTLDPGSNSIRFIDTGDATADASLTVYYRSGWIG